MPVVCVAEIRTRRTLQRCSVTNADPRIIDTSVSSEYISKLSYWQFSLTTDILQRQISFILLCHFDSYYLYILCKQLCYCLLYFNSFQNYLFALDEKIDDKYADLDGTFYRSVIRGLGISQEMCSQINEITRWIFLYVLSNAILC